MLFKGYYWGKMPLGFSGSVVGEKKKRKKRCFWVSTLQRDLIQVATCEKYIRLPSVNHSISN